MATHRHGCCVLQKFLDGSYKKLRNELIKSLINNCLVLIIDQFGNYVIQSVLLLNNKKTSSEIAQKISNNVPYYSKHRYSSNVVEKCFDYCEEREKKIFIEKLSPPEILEELILDDHGNYVIQKALHYSEGKIRENMLKNIIPLIPKIREVSFGDRLLSKLFTTYPQLNSNSIFFIKSSSNNNKKEIYKNNKNGNINSKYKYNDNNENIIGVKTNEIDKENNLIETNKNNKNKKTKDLSGNKKFK